MSLKIRNNIFAVLCTFALVFTAVGVEAQSDDPILDDELICSIHSGDVYWVVPVALKQALEMHHGQAGTVETLGDFVSGLPIATSSVAVRIEGGYPDTGVSQDLDMLGYVTSTDIDAPVIQGAQGGVLRTLN